MPDTLQRFERCVDDVIRYRGIGNPHVQQAIAIILLRYTEGDLRQATVAQMVGLTPSELCAAFKSQTGLTFTEYLRRVRLDRASTLLVQSTKSIKEVWAGVGYSDAASFDHDFKARSGMTPTEYQARGIRSPMAVSVSSAVGTDPCPRPDIGDRHVLVVDDDLGARETLAAQLRLAGYEIAVCASGRDALQSTLSVEPDVIVLDFHLPDMDGFECLRALRSARPGIRPPVVLFTADWDVEDRSDEAHALGASIMSKLSDLSEIERLLASLHAMEGAEPRRG